MCIVGLIRQETYILAPNTPSVNWQEKRLESLMKMEQEDYPKAQQKAIEMYEQVEKPYVFYPGYNKDAMDYQVLLSFLVMVICVVIAAPIFSSDYQTEADAILRCTKHGRMKLATTKIVSALLISGIIYTICIGTYIIVSNSLFGWECTETSVQMLYSIISLVNMLFLNFIAAPFPLYSQDLLLFLLFIKFLRKAFCKTFQYSFFAKSHILENSFFSDVVIVIPVISSEPLNSAPLISSIYIASFSETAT